MMMRRMMIGFMEVGHSRKMIGEALEGIQSETTLPLRKLQAVLDWKKEEKEAFVRVYDITAKLDEELAELKSVAGGG